jgi:hypothetical protein
VTGKKGFWSVGKTFLPVKQCTQFEEMHAEGCGDIPYVCVFVSVQKKKGKHLTTRIQVWQEPISFATKYNV